MFVKLLKQVSQILLLIFFYYVGVFIQNHFDLMIPGSLIGMLLVFLLLVTNVVKVTWFEEGASVILTYMPLFFIPVTVGIMEYKSFIFNKGWALILVVIVSTFLTFMVSGKLAQKMATKQKGSEC